MSVGQARSTDLIVSCTKSKTLSRSNVARFEVNLQDVSMLADQRLGFGLNCVPARERCYCQATRKMTGIKQEAQKV